MYSIKEAHPTTVRLPAVSVVLLWLGAISHLGRTSAAVAAAEDGKEDGKGLLATANDMFDAVWCPLPTWARILLVIGAWVLCYRVATDVVNVSKGKNK